MRAVILFDGQCLLCNKAVQFIIKGDPDLVFSFASLQSKIGTKLLNEYKTPSHIDSLVLIEGEHIYFKSTAALLIFRKLSHAWPLYYFLILIPRPIRDFFYDIIAKNRFTWFGQRKSCLIPNKIDEKRFL